MAQLALKGHPTRGKEVIEILEILGGKNSNNLKAISKSYFYYIKDAIIDNMSYLEMAFTEGFKTYTLEEFEEKFPYKVDDVVVNHKYGKGDITQMLWIDNEIVYEIHFEDYMAYCKANELCKYDAFKGLLLQELTEYLSHATREELDKTMNEIEIALAPFKVGDKVIVKGYEKMGEDEVICVFKTYDDDIKYKTKNHLDTHYFMEDSLTRVEKSNKEKGVNLQKLERQLDEALAKETPESLNKWMDEENMNTNNLCTRCVYAVDNHCGLRGFTNDFNRPYCSARNTDKLPNGFELQPDGYFSWVDSKPQYPKDYVECCKVLGISRDDVEIDLPHPYQQKIFNLFKLHICRDAYWKVYGEQMGLGKPWEPDWTNTNSNKYCIYYVGDEIKKQPMLEVRHFLAFPTKEMRDTFYENFKDLIEQCKELL